MRHGQEREWMTSAGLLLLAATACSVLAAVPAAAIEFRGGQHVVVGSDEVILDDLYATGETVTVDGKVEGDLIVCGQEVRMNGVVTGDLMACGGLVLPLVTGRALLAL